VSWPYTIPVEDLDNRDPEWVAVEPGYGQPPMMRDVEWDPVHGEVRSSGPVVEIKPPLRPA
jgi:hypothetical protein